MVSITGPSLKSQPFILPIVNKDAVILSPYGRQLLFLVFNNNCESKPLSNCIVPCIVMKNVAFRVSTTQI